MAREFVLEEATRKGQKGRIALAGLSGSGKTRTALEVAKELTNDGKVLVIDTEEASSGLYAEEFNGWKFQILNWAPPFDPRDLVKAIKQFETEFDAIVIDSFSHYWAGEGGVREIADNHSKGGNTFVGWKVATPIQEQVIQTIVRSQCHMIICMRAKVGAEMVNGKVVKVPMQIVQRENTIYEMTIAGTIEVTDHSLFIEKSRFSDVADRKFMPGEGTRDFARAVKDWLESAEAATATEEMTEEIEGGFTTTEAERQESVNDPVLSKQEQSELIDIFDAIADETIQANIKQKFVETVGLPSDLRSSQLEEATSLAVELVSNQ